MEKQVKRKFYWRKLDDQAKVFALASNNKYSSIFRLSVILKEKIDAKILQKALELALEKYKAFKVKMKRGLFWYYFQENEKKPIIKIEDEYPFKKVNTKENNDYLFKVTYFENKINIDFFHVLTDGNGGTEFLKEVIYKYLQIKYPKEFQDIAQEEKIIEDSENAYKKNYKKHSKKTPFPKAYMIQGEFLPKGEIGINHFNINLEEIKNCTRTKECSLSMYLVAMIAYSIYETNYKINQGNKPINLCVPIDLKKYFSSETISNFFSYMMISLKLKNNQTYTFDDILNMVKKEFEQKLKIERIIETMSSDAGKTNNIFIRTVPLFIKKLAVRLGSLEVKRHFTMTISNIGKFEIDNKYSEYVEKFFIILAPDWAEKVKCGICSYKDNLVVTFGTLMKDSFIENSFKELLEENNVDFKIEGNEVNVISN